MDNYIYDCFISWTGRDRDVKNTIASFLEENNIKVYNSDNDCKGKFRLDYYDALRKSKVYLLILTDNLLNDPNISKEGYFSEVRKEIEIALDLDARGLINTVTIECSKKFDFRVLPSDDDEVGKFFYSALVGFSKIVVNNGITEEIKQATLRKVSEFIKARDLMKPLPSNVVKIPLVKTKISPLEDFVGREEELQEIDDAFSSGQKIVVLSGMGGIGKSELAKKYITSVGQRFICPQIISFQDDAVDALKQIASLAMFTEEVESEIRNLPKEEQLDYKIKKLKELKRNVVLLIDNFNCLDEDELNHLLEYIECNLLITSRRDDFSLKDVTCIKIEKMSLNDASNIFLKDIKLSSNEEENKDFLFKEIYDLVNGHTMTLSIISKMIKIQRLSLQSIIDKLENPVFMEEKVSYIHNTYKDNATLNQHLLNLFNISHLNKASEELSEKEFINVQNILRSLSLIPLNGIKESTIKNILHLTTANEIIYLASRGWIERRDASEDFVLSMHPLISSLISNELKPDLNNSREIINYLNDFASLSADNDFYSLNIKKTYLSFMITRLASNNSYSSKLSETYLNILIKLGDVIEEGKYISKVKDNLPSEDLASLFGKDMMFKIYNNDNFIDIYNSAKEYVGILEKSKPAVASLIAVQAGNAAFERGENEIARELFSLGLSLALKGDNMLVIFQSYLSLIAFGKNAKILRKCLKRMKQLRKASKQEGMYLLCSFIIGSSKYLDYSKGIMGLFKISSEYDSLNALTRWRLERFSVRFYKRLQKVKEDDPTFFVARFMNAFVDENKEEAEDSINDFLEYNKKEGLPTILNNDNYYLTLLKATNANAVSLYIDKKTNELEKYKNDTIEKIAYLDFLVDGLTYTGNYSKALEFVKELFDLQERLLPKYHVSKGLTCEKGAGLYKNMGDYLLANRLYTTALTIYSNTIPCSEKYVSTYTDYLINLSNIATNDIDIEMIVNMKDKIMEIIQILKLEKSSIIIKYIEALSNILSKFDKKEAMELLKPYAYSYNEYHLKMEDKIALHSYYSFILDLNNCNTERIVFLEEFLKQIKKPYNVDNISILKGLLVGCFMIKDYKKAITYGNEYINIVYDNYQSHLDHYIKDYFIIYFYNLTGEERENLQNDYHIKNTIDPAVVQKIISGHYYYFNINIDKIVSISKNFSDFKTRYIYIIMNIYRIVVDINEYIHNLEDDEGKKIIARLKQNTSVIFDLLESEEDIKEYIKKSFPFIKATNKEEFFSSIDSIIEAKIESVKNLYPDVQKIYGIFMSVLLAHHFNYLRNNNYNYNACGMYLDEILGYLSPFESPFDDNEKVVELAKYSASCLKSLCQVVFK